MKEILLVDASPRKGGNSEMIVDILAKQLKGCEASVFKMREHDCRSCLACATCQKRTRKCASSRTILRPCCL